MNPSMLLQTADCGMRYACYLPETGKRCPLVIYLHGRFHGFSDRTFPDSGLAFWQEARMQQQFREGGACLLMPRLEEYRASARQTARILHLLDEFLQKNSRLVDDTQLYLMGGSAGGGLAWRLLESAPERFRRAVVLCATRIPPEASLQTLAHTPVWEISAVKDPLISYERNQKVTWQRLCKTSSVKAHCRWTVFEDAVMLPDGTHPIAPHFLAKTIGWNLCTMKDGRPFPGMTTVDGEGNRVSVSFENSVIQWLQADI